MCIWSPGLLKQSITNWVASTTETYSITVLEARSLKIKVLVGPHPLSVKTLGETVFHAFLLAFDVVGNPWHSLTCEHITFQSLSLSFCGGPLYVSVSVSKFLSFYKEYGSLL